MSDVEPNDKQVRIQYRRDRILNRLNECAPNKVSAPLGSTHLSDNQVALSFERLDKIQAKSTDIITEARVRTDQREAKRRDIEEGDNKKRAEVLKQLHDTRQGDDVVQGWQQCLEATDIQDIYELLDKQKSTCEVALTKLERVREELGSELREKEHEYVIAIKRNRQEVELLQKCIMDEHNMLMEEFQKELKRIEESLLADRNRALNANKNELEALISKRKMAETKSLEQRRHVIDKQRNEVQELEFQAESDREGVKMKLESEVQRLELELQDARARHLLDADKLRYNVRVLTELSENEEALKKQKRRIMKGKEALNCELDDKQHAKANGIRQNKLLEDDCERIEKQSSGLKDKFERFKISDDEKYRAVLSMHQDDLQKLQGTLKRSQEFIFGGAIGCVESAEQSCTSEVTWPSDLKLNKIDECKFDRDEFELFESESNNGFSKK